MEELESISSKKISEMNSKCKQYEQQISLRSLDYDKTLTQQFTSEKIHTNSKKLISSEKLHVTIAGDKKENSEQKSNFEQ